MSRRSEELARIWDKLIQLAVKDKEPWQKVLNDVDQYFAGDHNFIYQEINKKHFNVNNCLALTVNLAFQVRGYLGPHLYHENPTRIVVPLTTNSVLDYYARVAKVVINLTPGLTNQVEHIRNYADDTTLGGVGVLQCVKDKSLNVVTHVHRPIDDFFVDPDARDLAEAKWIAIRHQEPLWKVRERWPKTTKDLKANMHSESSRMPDRKESLFGKTADMVRYFVIYSKMGSGFRAKGSRKELLEQEAGKMHRRIVTVCGHNRILEESDWDVPVYSADGWPVEPLSFTATRKGTRDPKVAHPFWSVSLMKAAIGLQMALDVVCTMILELIKTKNRTIIGARADLLDEEKLAAFAGSGDLTQLFLFEPKGSEWDGEINRVFSTLAQSPLDLGQLIAWAQWLEAKFGEVTGMLPLLRGGASMERQIRSATEAQVRNETSKTRVEDYEGCLERALSRAAKKEFVAVRRVMSWQEVARLVRGHQDLGEAPFKMVVTVEGEILDADDLRGSAEKPGLWPAAAEYYDDPQQAEQAAEPLRQVLMQLWQQKMLAQGMGPALRLGLVEPDFDVSVKQVTLADLWEDTAGYSAEDLARECHVEIEAGSATKPSHDQLANEANFQMQNVGMVALQQYGDVNTYNEVLDKTYDTMRTPRKRRTYLDAQRAEQMQQAQLQAAQQQQQREAEAAQGEQEHELQKVTLQNQGTLQNTALKVANDREAALEQIEAKGTTEITKATATAAAKVAFDPPGAGGVR